MQTLSNHELTDELASEHLLDAARIAAEAAAVPVERVQLQLSFGERGPIWKAQAGIYAVTEHRPVAALRKLAAEAALIHAKVA